MGACAAACQSTPSLARKVTANKNLKLGPRKSGWPPIIRRPLRGIHCHLLPFKTQKTGKNGKKWLFLSILRRARNRAFLLCKPLCLSGFKVVRDTGFEPVTPTVSR